MVLGFMTPYVDSFENKTFDEIMNPTNYSFANLGLCFRRMVDNQFDFTELISQYPQTSTKFLINTKIPQITQIIKSVMLILNYFGVSGVVEATLQSFFRRKMTEALRAASKILLIDPD